MTANNSKLPITRPVLAEAEAEAASRVILSGWVTQGPEVAAFEADFAQLTGARHACAVSNCTAALHLALLALDVGPGDEVITVSHSYIATANAVAYVGATPIFVDVDPRSNNIDPDRVAEAITPRTRAVLAVHQVGVPCDLRRLKEVADRAGVPIVEDAACAIGSQILWEDRWENIGRPHSHIACFSFHPRKVITTGDGGMLTTNDPELDRRVRLLRQHGMSVNDLERHSSSSVVFEEHSVLGYNYRMTDVQAAIGREQLKRLEEIVEERRKVAGWYDQALASVEGLDGPHVPDWARSNYQSYLVRLPDGADQRTVMERMLDQEIATRRGVMCAHREKPYIGDHDLPYSEAAQDRHLVVPLFPGMAESDVDRVVSSLAVAVEGAG